MTLHDLRHFNASGLIAAGCDVVTVQRVLGHAKTRQLVIKVQHSRNSHLRLADARAALSIIHTTTDDFMAEVKQLCATEVSQQNRTQFLGAWVPLVDDRGEPLKGRSKTMAEKKRAVLQSSIATTTG